MWHRVRQMMGVACLAWGCSSTSMLWAMTPNPLESAYWRFEEGQNGAVVPAPVSDPDGNGNVLDNGHYDTVKDSLNDNNLRKTAGTPTYTNVVAPTPLKSGASNTRAMSFTPNSDLTTFVRNVDNGIIQPGNGFTIEAAFRANSVGGGVYHGILSKQSEPDDANPDPILGNLPTAALKIRGDNSRLMFEQYDVDKNLVNVSSSSPINANQWYYAAVVNDGSLLSLYLDSNDGNGYQLQSSAFVSGAMYMGDPSNPDPAHHIWPDWYGAWSVGRGYFAGASDWFDGIIDEVRISNSALAPADFLFAPGGDFNGDGVVDAADYVLWRKGPSTTYPPAQYDAWRAHYGAVPGGGAGVGVNSAVPEPATLVLLIVSTAGWCLRRRRTA